MEKLLTLLKLLKLLKLKLLFTKEYSWVNMFLLIYFSLKCTSLPHKQDVFYFVREYRNKWWQHETLYYNEKGRWNRTYNCVNSLSKKKNNEVWSVAMWHMCSNMERYHVKIYQADTKPHGRNECTFV